MPDSTQARPNVAVIGGGVSGLTAAYLLQKTHHVTLFEADERVGGHAHTHDVPVGDGGTAAVDSGFIVLNDRTYPLLQRLFAELGVQTRPTEMSMSISCTECGLNYVGGRKANGIFAQRQRLLDPTFWRMLLSIKRFQKAALALLDDDPDSTLTYGEFLDRHDFDRHFVTHYAPTWHTVVGGSRTYVGAITERLDVVRNRTRVTGVSREPDSVTVDDEYGAHHRFDKVVVATHADDALHLLTDADAEEKDLLGSFGYSTNVAWLHRDESLLPAKRNGRASWNYRLEGCDTMTDRSKVSYWMNRLQGHPESDPLVVTLNPDDTDTPRDAIAQMTYLHPTYTAASVAAQSRLHSLDTDRVAFAGAYHGWGFHEDGCRSGVAAAEALGATW